MLRNSYIFCLIFEFSLLYLCIKNILSKKYVISTIHHIGYDKFEESKKMYEELDNINLNMILNKRYALRSMSYLN